MTRIPRILLITSATMTEVNGGTVLLRGLIKNIPNDKLCWAVVGGDSRRIPGWMQGYRRVIFPSIIFNRIIQALARRLPIARLWGWVQFRLYPWRVISKILAFLQEEQVEKLWVVASGQAIPVAERLHRQTGLPVHVTVHDDIEGHSSPAQAALLRDDFQRLLQAATTSDLTSTSMQAYYEERYSAPRNPLVFWNGFFMGEVLPPPELRQRVRSIGYAGNIWSPDNFRILLKALELMNKDRKPEDAIRIEVFSERLQKHFGLTSPYLIYHGLVEPEKIAGRLRKCDLLYVPMSFLTGKAILARTSLPGKIQSYMKVQVPILAHGPEYATHIGFVRDYQVGLTSTSQDPGIVAAELLGYEAAYDQRMAASQRSRELSLGEFSPEVAWDRFKAVLYRI
ncbi:MAG: glycosyltransferase [Fidelibacterota bacterium]|nr:MAG: glycosyltransferase [Candidatus Neomarinimicrobiota bacterium]